jgi:hypothetical protein
MSETDNAFLELALYVLVAIGVATATSICMVIITMLWRLLKGELKEDRK